jgi:hypothetical protein
MRRNKRPLKALIPATNFDILENGQRSLLGAFTGPKTLAETLTRRAGGLPANAHQLVPKHGKTFKFGETGSVWGQQQMYETITTSLSDAVLRLSPGLLET